MTTSNKSTIAYIAAACILSMPAALADTVEFHNGDALTGTIRSFHQGLVTLASPLAHTPLEIKVDAIKEITFPKHSAENPTHTEHLTLANNDIIPCNVISMDKKHLHITTWYAGKFSIPRGKIQTLQFGISQEKTIFKATKAPKQWNKRSGSWTHTGNTYTSNGSGMLAEEIDLPENIRFKFDLSWKDNPNFVFRFCAENTSATTKQSTYELTFNSAGMQISRYESRKHPAAPLANIPIKPQSLDKQKINIDLRTNRKEGIITLYIDQKLIGTWPDPFPTAKGNHFIINNRSSSRKSCVISNFEIQSIHGTSPPRHREKSALSSSDTDTVIDSQGEKISGTITSIEKGKPNKRIITMHVVHSDQPLRIPDRRTSTLFFAQAKNAPKFPPLTFTAVLKNHGTIQMESPKIINGKLTSQHPILGPCSIDPKALSHIKLPNIHTTHTGAKKKP